MLRIGIDGTCLGSGRGYGRFLREMLPPLIAGEPACEYVLFVDAQTAARADLGGLLAGAPPGRLTVEILDTAESQAAAASASGSRSPLDLWRMGRAVARLPLDVLWFPSVFSWFPVRGRVPKVIGFHDTIAERYARIVFPTLRTRALWRLKSWLARRSAAVVLTQSEFARRCLHELLGIPLARIHVTLLAPASTFVPVTDAAPLRRWLEAHELPPDDPYWICVGGLNPHKNMPALVRAFARVPARPDGRTLRLLLVGDFAGDVFHADVASLRECIAGAGLTSRVALPGFVPDSELRHLYAGAIGNALVSLEEGFGLPAVEAAACGTPCVATIRSPLPEVLEGGGLFVDPEDESAIADALTQLTHDTALRRRCADVALARARALSWKDAADAARGVLVATARHALRRESA